MCVAKYYSGASNRKKTLTWKRGINNRDKYRLGREELITGTNTDMEERDK